MDSIRINDPRELMEYISHQADILRQYAQLLEYEAKELVPLGNEVTEKVHQANMEKQGTYTAMEQTGRQEASEAKQRAMASLQKKLAKQEETARMLQQCNEDLETIRQDYGSLIKDSTTLSDNGMLLANKIGLLMEKMIDAI